MGLEYVIEDEGHFSAWDYVVFVAVLILSAVIGLYYAFTGDKQKTTKEFLMANRSMSTIPVSVSILASFFSSTTLLGTPAEIYMEGTMFYLGVLGAMLAPVVGAFVFGPYFYRLKVTSVFEYLEKRFESKSVRVLAVILCILKMTVYTGIVLLGPATALQEVTGFPTWAGIVTAAAVCAFYSTLGGLKAVIWADVFQLAVMIAGMAAVLIQGSIEVGGFSNAWRIAEEGGRIDFWDFNPDPTIRHTFWTVVIGAFFQWLFAYTVDQRMIQRFGATKDLKQAKIALILNVPGVFLIMTIATFAGIFMFAYYAECDPLTLGTVTDPNQLMARFVMDILSFAPGVPGLFIASLFAGALSSISSLINSLSTITWVDICRLIPGSEKLTDATATTITKVLGLFYMGVGVGFAFLFTNVGGTIIQMAAAFNGSIGAPLTGIYILGCFFPWANWIGAFVGALAGFAFPMWVNIGAYITEPDVGNNLGYSLEGCPMMNVTDNVTSYTLATTDNPSGTVTMGSEGDEISGIDKLYTLSYMYYSLIGILVTVFVGLLVSFMTGYTRARDIDPRYMMSYVDTMWPCFPKSCRQKSNCGVQYKKLEDEVIEFEPDELEADDHGKVNDKGTDNKGISISDSYTNLDKKKLAIIKGYDVTKDRTECLSDSGIIRWLPSESTRL